MWGPPSYKLVYKPHEYYSYLRIINYNSWSYVHQLSYRLGAPHCIWLKWLQDTQQLVDLFFWFGITRLASGVIRGGNGQFPNLGTLNPHDVRRALWSNVAMDRPAH